MKLGLPLIIRLGERRVEQARGALGDDLRRQREAGELCRECEAAVARAVARAAEADRDFRTQPHCQQRLLLREVRAGGVAMAQAQLRDAEDALAAARTAVVEATQVLLRAEARVEEFRRLLKQQRAQAAERAASREEDDLCGRVKPC